MERVLGGLDKHVVSDPSMCTLGSPKNCKIHSLVTLVVLKKKNVHMKDDPLLRHPSKVYIL